MKSCSDDRYSIFETSVNYGDINQRWVVVDSREMHARKSKTFDRQIEKELTQARKSVKKLGNVVFACEVDARKAADRWMSENPCFLLRNVSTCMISRRIDAKRGRPNKGESLDIGYIVEAEVDRNERMIASERAKLGRFVLASNDIAMGGELMLQYYKAKTLSRKASDS